MNESRIFQTEPPVRLLPNAPQRVPVTEEEADNGRFNGDESVEDRSVKFFIMNCKTAEFVRCDSLWTREFNEALDFLSVQGAICWGVKELKASFQIVKIQMNRVLGSIKIVIPPLLWSKTSGTPHTVLEFCQRVLLAEARQSPVGSLKPADLVAPLAFDGHRGMGVALTDVLRQGGNPTHLYRADEEVLAPVLQGTLAASLAACRSWESVAIRQ
jgi:hypothetical protein